METVYTSASFIISCFSGGTNLLDIINVGAASAATPTCMRVTGGTGNSIILYGQQWKSLYKTISKRKFMDKYYSFEFATRYD